MVQVDSFPTTEEKPRIWLGLDIVEPSFCFSTSPQPPWVLLKHRFWGKEGSRKLENRRCRLVRLVFALSSKAGKL